MAEIILYSNKLSRGRAVHWLLEELQVPYRIEHLAFGEAMKVSQFRAINPMGKVPALTHGDAVVTETPAILTYLAEHFAEKGLIPPAGSSARAAFYRWMFFIAGPLEAATSATFLGWQAPERTPLGTSCQGFLGYGSLDLTLDTLDDLLQQSAYVCGNTFTAADIYLASHLAFGMRYTQAYPPRPSFTAYLDRLLQRPAKLRADAA
ncbi:glutathione S-transferase family protein [Methylophilus medardicus]|uniref:Glutathione S-transferase family protein n=1 Tax=Methylophilus medardicus TaxID=2588534 RepID=A0A5B8CVH3_9PROT|nr:glutathione S-transferase family protein [Methylophilus medardicus]QDC44925.1 glutathione S-transferase family protein [Methylophilus medardicus]QDC49932.1 glutathione S-transferase family protein [Methylophilus medardicus]QDC53637.1 glutathione S-transferase family protein [Methylophilus medardicus]